MWHFERGCLSHFSPVMMGEGQDILEATQFSSTVCNTKAGCQARARTLELLRKSQYLQNRLFAHKEHSSVLTVMWKCEEIKQRDSSELCHSSTPVFHRKPYWEMTVQRFQMRVQKLPPPHSPLPTPNPTHSLIKSAVRLLL